MVDAKKEKIAVAEANKLGIPIVAIVDTNADPDLITVPIAGNDDAIRSVELITAALSDVIKEARAADAGARGGRGAEAETYSSDAGTEGDADDDASAAGRAASGGRSRRRSPRGSRPSAEGARRGRPRCRSGRGRRVGAADRTNRELSAAPGPCGP